MNAETAAIIENQIQKFREKFGREPGPKDPIFFDPDSFTPQPYRLGQFQSETEKAMSEAGIRPEVIYAYRKTGLVVTEENYKKLPADARAEWEEAVKEYFEMVAKGRAQ
jgi:hypothetical protein